MDLPVDYTKLDWRKRKEVREQYIIEQKEMCYYCRCNLYENPPEWVTEKQINWKLFPEKFLDNPVHLQHNHNTGMTEGAIHAYCNAVLWQYFGR